MMQAFSSSCDCLVKFLQDLKDEAEKIHRTNIIICTPGRLLQHMDQTSAFHVSDLLMLGVCLIGYCNTVCVHVRLT